MGRRGIRKRGNKKANSSIQVKGITQNYVLAELYQDNKQFFEYYKHQGIVREDEWDSFIECLRSPLPSSFRVQGCYKEAQALISLMNERYFSAMAASNDKDVDIPKALPWYPCAFQTEMSRAKIRSHEVLKAFHNFLVTEAELGNISRQEAVSMIPPLLLDVKPSHKVLDACAAPGSKTVQIIEMMHSDSDMPEGLVVANDADNSRCYLLVRQALKRMPTPSCVVINEDAAFLPKLNLSTDSSKETLFDRVLCDVMCSGDGTIRKNPEMWRLWTPQKALGLHKLQIRIAHRSLQLLAVGGLMVYSTCSLNPIEDEAVVASLLRLGNGAIELVDVSEKLPSLKRTPGISFWKVFDRDMKEYARIDDVPENMQRAIIPSMFPPNDEEKEKFHLERCFRILPHAQNTGGFFVAVLRKAKAIPDDEPNKFRAPLPKKRKIFKEDPFVFLTDDDPRWKDIANHYGIIDTFPYRNLLGRTNEVDKKRTLYLVNDAVKQFLELNQEKVKVINAGVRVFGRVESKFDLCRFRMSQDGVSIVFPYLTKRVVEISAEDMYKILKTDDGNKNYPREKLTCDKNLQELESGSVILHTTVNGARRVICAWMGARSVAPYISKEERIHAIRMLGYDTTDMENAICSRRQSKAIRERELAEERREIEANGKLKEDVAKAIPSTSETGDKMMLLKVPADDQDVAKIDPEVADRQDNE